MKVKTVITRLLLAFVFISIGFALGKETTRRSMQKAAMVADEPASQSASDKVIVYYLYATIRCVTCNQIESLTREIVHTQFADALQAGRLEWKEVNFQSNEALAKRYDVASSTVVVVKVRGGQEVGFKRLDDVWTLVEDRQKFVAYVSDAIRWSLDGEGA